MKKEHKKTPDLFYTQMSFSFDHAIYCIDTFEEHVQLLDTIARKVCKLDSSAVPERFDRFFKPYLIESMEFEYVQLNQNANRFEKAEFEKTKRENKTRRAFDNMKLYPVRSVFEEVIDRLMEKVKMIKGYFDVIYAILFRGYDVLFAGCTCPREFNIRLGLVFLAYV